MYIIVCNPHIDANRLLYFKGVKEECIWPEREFFEWCEEMDVAYIDNSGGGGLFIAPSTSDSEAEYIQSLLPRGLKEGTAVVVYRFRGRSSKSFVPYSFEAMWNYIDQLILDRLCDLLTDEADTRRRIKMMEGNVFDNVILVTPL